METSQLECSSLYESGIKREGTYILDKDDLKYQAHCKHGWTVILRRGQFGNPVVRS